MKTKAHNCEQIFCKVCQIYYAPDTYHTCYIQPKNYTKTEAKMCCYIYYDIETTLSGPNNKFKPLYISAQVVCKLCSQVEPENDNFICKLGKHPCGGRTVSFHHSTNVCQLFLQWLIDFHRITKKKTLVILVSHNQSCFDGIFLLNEMLYRNDINFNQIIRRGTAIISARLNDSLEMRDSTDCDDGDATEFPGQLWYADCDGDGIDRAASVTACDLAAADALTPCTDVESPDGGWTHAVGNDCDDENSGNYPGNAEVVADSLDQNCDTFDDCYEDLDSDTYGSVTVITGDDLNCNNTAGEADDSTDCEDGDATEFPGQLCYVV